MQARDIASESYQKAQKKKTKTGYIHREIPLKNADLEIKTDGQKKQCHLSDQKKSALNDWIKSNLMNYRPSIPDAYRIIDKSLISDDSGNKISLASFRRFVANVRAGRI